MSNNMDDNIGLGRSLEDILEEKGGWFHPLFYYTKDPDHYFARQDIKETMRRITARNLIIFSELKTVLDVLNKAAVPAIILKGLCLAEDYYPPGVRPLSDLDLLIKREDIEKSVKIINNLGYKLLGKGLPFSIHRDFAEKVTYHRTNGVMPVTLDLHTSLGPYPYLGRVKTAVLWQAARPRKVAGIDVLCLCPEHFLLHLCLHMFQHRYENWLFSACDMLLLTRRYHGDEINWSYFLKNVSDYKLHLPVAFSLKKTAKYFGRVSPGPVLEQLENYRAGIIEQKLFNYYFGKTGAKDKYLIQFLTQPGLISKARCLFITLFPSRRIIREIYPDSGNNIILYDYYFYYKFIFMEVWRYVTAMAGGANKH
ncbi:MAG: hypothetical protein A4E55_00244 [Pelotomaculum sp. PtaU1.Bin035]|nr:MAG: hypothetical protein A4E55_00244 [Pelotomaculum sp. PtaU1.Bin035]